MRQITKNINVLKEQDDLNKILFFIYKLSNDPEYSYLSELIYVLDKKSLINFCTIFGGCTIKVPTLEDLEYYSKTLLVYKLTKDGVSYAEACSEVGLNPNEKQLKGLFNKLKELELEYETNID